MKTVTRRLALAATLGLSACVVAPDEARVSPDPLPLFSERLEAPRMAIMEHVLDGYFNSDITNRPTVCATWNVEGEDETLKPEEEVALIARFPQLAPMGRCSRTPNGWRDTETEQPALVFLLHDFTCSSETRCSAWGGYRSDAGNSMSYLYQGEWDGGEWQITRDMRIIAE